ncbi:hypothetical protein PGC35_20785 [Psychrobacillus sp. PGGUH221]|uniref:hypothetical protein n=1 Tax=Psychrobacillus sp. PGGUH221 TaxID=3020058 RepID=UPI0035C739C7
MESELFAIDVLWAFVLVNVVYLVSILFFRKHKQLISVIHILILLIMAQYFIIAQRDYIFDEYPTIAYPMIAVVLLSYYVFFRDLNSFIKTKKFERDASSKEIK